MTEIYERNIPDLMMLQLKSFHCLAQRTLCSDLCSTCDMMIQSRVVIRFIVWDEQSDPQLIRRLHWFNGRSISVGVVSKEGLIASIVGNLSGLLTGFHWELCIYSVILLVCFKNVANLWIASHLYVYVNFRGFSRNFFLASLAKLRYHLLDLSVRKGVNFKACLKQKDEATILPVKPVASRESSAPRAPSGLELLALEEVEIPVTPQKKDQALVLLRLNRGLYGGAPSEVRAGVWLIRMSYFSPHVCFSLTSGS